MKSNTDRSAICVVSEMLKENTNTNINSKL